MYFNAANSPQLQAACDGWKEAVRIAREKDAELRVKDAMIVSLQEEIEMMKRNVANSRRGDDESIQLMNESVESVQMTVTDLINNLKKLLKNNALPNVHGNESLDDFYFGESSFQVSDSQQTTRTDRNEKFFILQDRLRVIDHRLKKMLMRLSFNDMDMIEQSDEDQPSMENRMRSPFLDNSRSRSPTIREGGGIRSNLSSPQPGSSPQSSPGRGRVIPTSKGGNNNTGTKDKRLNTSTGQGHTKSGHSNKSHSGGDHHVKKTEKVLHKTKKLVGLT